jgi:hypothetical protein
LEQDQQVALIRTSRGLPAERHLRDEPQDPEQLIHCRDDAELRKLWNNTDADFYIAGDQAGRNFLTLIRDSIQ